jgi:hypothetical protein
MNTERDTGLTTPQPRHILVVTDSRAESVPRVLGQSPVLGAPYVATKQPADPYAHTVDEAFRAWGRSIVRQTVSAGCR